MKSLLSLIIVGLLFSYSEARTITEKSLSKDFTVTIRRVDDTYWQAFVQFTTLDDDGKIVANKEEIEVNPILNSSEKDTVLLMLNQLFNNLHTYLAIPTPSPTPVPTPTPTETVNP